MIKGRTELWKFNFFKTKLIHGEKTPITQKSLFIEAETLSDAILKFEIHFEQFKQWPTKRMELKDIESVSLSTFGNLEKLFRDGNGYPVSESKGKDGMLKLFNVTMKIPNEICDESVNEFDIQFVCVIADGIDMIAKKFRDEKIISIDCNGEVIL